MNKPLYLKCSCKHFPVINDRCAVHGGALKLIESIRKQTERKMPIGPLVRLP